MGKILQIVLNDLRVFLADRSNLPGLLLTPVAMTIIIGLVNGGAFGGTSTTLRLDVIDRDQSVASEQLLSAIGEADPALTLCPQENTEEDPCRLDGGSSLALERGLERVAEGTSIGLLEIPPNFAEAIEQQRPTTVVLHSISDFGSGQTAQQAVSSALEQINGAAGATEAGTRAYLQLTGSGIDPEERSEVETSLYAQALEAWRHQPVQVSMEFSGEEENRSLTGSLQQGLGHSVPGMGSMFVMMTVFGGMAALIEERRQWTLQRLAAMPISRPAMLAGKILARFSLGLLQFLVIFVVGAVLGMDFGRDPAALAIVALSYTLAITALSFAIGSRLSNPSQAAGLTLLLALTLAPLGGAWWPIEISPNFMQLAGRISPVYWAMDAFTALTYERALVGDIIPSILVLLGITLVAFLIAVPRFRYEVDQGE